uniref:Probable aminopeptidase NPEPL1 N-terminal domain-containing protein n=1 Tax=Clastoptera arizonana TaxID=38151 RepID=A0A1B6CJQ1_9HEMI
MNINIKFNNGLDTCDPQNTPVLIVGQLKNLNQVNYDTIKVKLQPRVTEEIYSYALSNLHPTPIDSVNLHLNCATLAALTGKSSRHNAPSRPHTLTKIVKSLVTGNDEYIVVVCEEDDVFPSGCAIARAFPLYSRKTHRSSLRGALNSITVIVEFLIVGENKKPTPLSQDVATTLQTVTAGIRLAARLVDTPCNEMNVTNFLKVSFNQFCLLLSTNLMLYSYNNNSCILLLQYT